MRRFLCLWALTLALITLVSSRLTVVEGFVSTSFATSQSITQINESRRNGPRSRTSTTHVSRTNMFFGGSSGAMPKLYDGWFKKTGQIQKDIIAGAKSALRTGKPVEVCFFPVPNIDEVQFGTTLNKAFGTEVAKDLGMGDYKPGSTIRTYLVQYSNIYWAKKLADGLGGRVWVATTDGLRKDASVVEKPGNAKFCSLRKPDTLEDIKKGDTVIVVAPGPTAEWASSAQRFKEQKVIFLNGPLSESYDLGGPLKDLEQGYYLKRISKGYAFRIHPKPWEAILEKPEGGLEILATYKDKPLLRDASKLVREESMKRFGMANDRWTNDKRLGGRL